MEALVVEFLIKPEHVAAFGAAIIDNARASRETEPGCRQFDVCTDPARPGLYFLYELYDDEAAVRALAGHRLRQPGRLDQRRREIGVLPRAHPARRRSERAVVDHQHRREPDVRGAPDHAALHARRVETRDVDTPRRDCSALSPADPAVNRHRAPGRPPARRETTAVPSAPCSPCRFCYTGGPWRAWMTTASS